MGSLWERLLTKEVITRGWHLARADVRQDFAEDLLSTDVFGSDLKSQVVEIIHRIQTQTYQPRPLFRIEVPKGGLGFRPGAVIPIQDRVVVSAIVFLIAEELDKKLPSTVYSWRVKSPYPKKNGSLFGESDITDLPFLKATTIRKYIDSFEGWYVLWPKFDQETRAVFKDSGYRFMATSDISAYFENIQLPILRDRLLQHLPDDESLIVNLLCSFLEAWCEKTGDGRPHYRGIPQGNLVSSFLGNFFLLPIDELFEELKKSDDLYYFRYMDDVRVFSKTRDTARRAILEMTRSLRAMHLNVQSAKTRIYDEGKGEVSRLLVDPRADELTELIEEINSAKKQKQFQRQPYIEKLSNIARREVPGGQKISGAKAPLEGLSMRVFMRWLHANAILENNSCVRRLTAELEKSSDPRITKKLVSAAKQFPRKRTIETAVLDLMSQGKIVLPHQEAECLRSIRYLSRVSPEIINHCWDRLLSDSMDRYLRMQSAYLLARTEVSVERIKKLESRFLNETDTYVQAAMTMLLVQRRYKNEEIVRGLVFHPNEKIRDLGRVFREVRNEPPIAISTLKRFFGPRPLGRSATLCLMCT